MESIDIINSGDQNEIESKDDERMRISKWNIGLIAKNDKLKVDISLLVLCYHKKANKIKVHSKWRVHNRFKNNLNSMAAAYHNDLINCKALMIDGKLGKITKEKLQKMEKNDTKYKNRLTYNLYYNINCLFGGRTGGKKADIRASFAKIIERLRSNYKELINKKTIVKTYKGLKFSFGL